MADTEIEVVPGATDEANPEIFNIQAMPPQPKEPKPGQLPEDMIKKFFEDGFVIVENFFDKKLLDDCREAVNELVDQLANKLYTAGKIKGLYKKLGFFERLIKIEADFPGANIILHKYGKLPQVMNRGHKTGKVGTHQCCHGGTWYVMLEDDEMKQKLDIDVEKDRVLCRVPYGGMLLLNNMIPHRSLPNISKQTRWSLDLRWQNPKLPNGFYKMKNSVLMRTEDNPNLEVDWDSFVGIDRHKVQREAVEDIKDVIPNAEDEDFDTTIQGPWMKKWEIVHVNDHVSKLDKNTDYATWHGHKA
ncbi:hypothetical protein ACF0H5_003345 [Mactra antiquata]